jgi:hypothetical protein
MNQHWFKAKTYGWGWTPVTWQAWAILFLYVGTVTGSAFVFLHRTPTPVNWIAYGCSLAVCTALLIGICLKTGEKPGWRWGRKKHDQ